jgi:hypothetical protein
LGDIPTPIPETGFFFRFRCMIKLKEKTSVRIKPWESKLEKTAVLGSPKKYKIKIKIVSK